MSDHSAETYRMQMFRRVQNRRHKTKEQIEKLQKEYANDEAAAARLDSPLPEPNICPECWFMHGRKTQTRPRVHPTQPALYDRRDCPQCNWVEDQPA